MSRSLGILSAALAFAIAAPLHAAPTTSAAAPVDSVTYHIDRHNQAVTVKDANEKTLATFFAMTPTIQGVFTKAAAASDTGIASTDKKALHRLRFTLEDQAGRQLWSTIVPVVSPLKFSFSYNADVSGLQLTIAHQTEDTSATDQPPFSRLVMVIGPDGRPVSMSDGHKTYNIAISPTSASFIGQDGEILLKGQGTPNDGAVFTTPTGNGSVKTTDTGAVVNLNGTKFEIKKVTKDGKVYSSFPWNGHNVLVEQPSTLSFTSDGDLTVNIPKTDKATVSK